MGSVSHGSWKKLMPNFQHDGGSWTRGNYVKFAKEKEWGAIFFFWE